MKKNFIVVLLLALLAALLQTVTIGVLKSLLASFILYSLLLCTGSFIVYCKKHYNKISKKDIKESLGINIINNRLQLVGFLSGFTIVIIMILGFVVFYKHFSNVNKVIDAAVSMGIQNNYLLVIAIAGLVFNATAEEIFWRGTLHNLLGLRPENQTKKQSKEKNISNTRTFKSTGDCFFIYTYSCGNHVCHCTITSSRIVKSIRYNSERHPVGRDAMIKIFYPVTNIEILIL